MTSSSSVLSPKTLEWRPDDEFRAKAVDPLRLRLLSAKTLATWRGPADTSGFPERRSTSGDSATTSTGCRTRRFGLGRRIIRPGPRLETLWGRSLYLRSTTISAQEDCRLPERFHSLSHRLCVLHRILRKHGMNRPPGEPKIPAHAHRWTRLRRRNRAIASRSTSSFSSGFLARPAVLPIT